MPWKISNVMDVDTQIASLLEKLDPITLEQMKDIRLMNRTDTKFVTTKEQLVKMLGLCQGKYYVQARGDCRVASYTTTYWDTEEHKFFLDHHNGRAPRQKMRVRTYMDTLDTFLEVKTKNNKKRTKKKRIMVPDQQVQGTEEVEEFLMERVKMHLVDMHPTVQNRFNRITLVNYAKTERLTIDFDINFHNFETDRDDDTRNLVIIELKRDGNVFSPILDVLRQLRIKPHGFSKYCIGSVMTNPGLKQNLFKPKLQYLKKLSGQY